MKLIARVKALTPVGRLVFFLTIVLALSVMAIDGTAFAVAESDPALCVQLERIGFGLMLFMFAALALNFAFNRPSKPAE
jgi:hypothetical protein